MVIMMMMMLITMMDDDDGGDGDGDDGDSYAACYDYVDCGYAYDDNDADVYDGDGVDYAGEW